MFLMRPRLSLILILACFGALFLDCYAPALFRDRQITYRDAGHYYYPLYKLIQEEWNQGRWPLWESQENAGMPLLGNPTAAVLYPGKLLFALLPYSWAARVYIMSHSALAFLATMVLMRSWGTSWFGSALSSLGYAFGAPILFQYCNIIYLIGAAWLPLGVHAVDRWVRLGRRWGLVELTIVLSMQVLGGDLEAAYLLGLASLGYAPGLAWSRVTGARDAAEGAKPRRSPFLVWLALSAVGVVVSCVVTLALGQRLPKLRETGKPIPPFWWMYWVRTGVTTLWAALASGILVYWVRRGCRLARGWRFPLGSSWLGLGSAAALAAAVSAAQLLPVIEFTRLTSRAAVGGVHDIYPFSIEPFRLVELAFPNILGSQFEGNHYWGDALRMPGVYPKVWVPSLYLGGLTLALAICSLAIRRGPPWRIWISVIAVVSLLGSLGQHTSPIWTARVIANSPRVPSLREWLADPGPIDPHDSTPIRQDGYLRDGDGGFYWWLTTALPGFRQFRFPAKLFTFTSLAMAALAGWGWDRLSTERARGPRSVFLALSVLTFATLAVVFLQRPAILAWLGDKSRSTLFGPFEAGEAYTSILRSLGQAAIVFGVGFVLTFLARRRPFLAGSAAVILMTVDLASANAIFVLTVPQSLFETKPEIVRVIEAAERDDPSPGPFRIHRMPTWHPLGWSLIASKNRALELVEWERDTIHPKYGINYGVEYTYTMGVAELYDYEWYFSGFPLRIQNPAVARRLGVEIEKEVIYFPRRAYDLWDTRYFITPFFGNGWRDENRGHAAFLFNSESVLPEPDKFQGPNGAETARSWIETRDYKVLRNRQHLPRAWIVHDARITVPVTGLAPESRSQAMQEILYGADEIWNDATQVAFDPRRIAWVGYDDALSLRPYLTGEVTRPSETVKVTYPSPQLAVLEVNLESPGIVVLADVYYPGWELTIDGKPAPIYRVNGLMRGAAVPAESHRLVFTYTPQSFRIGKLVSVAGLALFLFFGLFCAFWPIDPVLGTGALVPIN